MQIPTEVTVGRTKYTIRVLGRPKLPEFGYINYPSKQITLYKRSYFNNLLPARTRYYTFWHELTHAILYDMGRADLNNEKFVTAFSKRLHQAITSAKL